MKKVFVLFLLFIFLFSCPCSSAFNTSKQPGLDQNGGGTHAGGPGLGNYKNNTANSRTSADKNHNKREVDFDSLYEEFEKFWYVKNEEDRLDRFEEFLRTKNLDPDELEGYDAFLEETFHVYDLESLYDEFERYWDVEDGDDFQDRFEEFLASKNIDPDDLEDYDDFIDAVYEGDLDWDDFDRIYDDDIDDFADDYLDDYPDDDFYEDYGEYFDEVYYD